MPIVRLISYFFFPMDFKLHPSSSLSFLNKEEAEFQLPWSSKVLNDTPE